MNLWIIHHLQFSVGFNIGVWVGALVLELGRWYARRIYKSKHPGPSYPRYPISIDSDGVQVHDQYKTDRWKIECRRVLANTAPHFSHSHCSSCNLPWWVVEGHVEYFADGQGCFPICELCFKALGKQEAWPYYADFVAKNYPEAEEDFKKRFFSGTYFQPMPSDEDS